MHERRRSIKVHKVPSTHRHTRQPLNVWPPALDEGETDDERDLRLGREREARRLSECIDHDIELERVELRKRRPKAKILLLGEHAPTPVYIVPVRTPFRIQARQSPASRPC